MGNEVEGSRRRRLETHQSSYDCTRKGAKHYIQKCLPPNTPNGGGQGNLPVKATNRGRRTVDVPRLPHSLLSGPEETDAD